MPLYCKNKMDVARCVEDTLTRLSTDWQWTMIIKPDTSEGYSARIAIDTWSEDTGKKLQEFLNLPMNTSQQNTPDG